LTTVSRRVQKVDSKKIDIEDLPVNFGGYRTWIFLFLETGKNLVEQISVDNLSIEEMSDDHLEKNHRRFCLSKEDIGVASPIFKVQP
jgi:hypothetical protein